jgi:hypothetical protein
LGIDPYEIDPYGESTHMAGRAAGKLIGGICPPPRVWSRRCPCPYSCVLIFLSSKNKNMPALINEL